MRLPASLLGGERLTRRAFWLSLKSSLFIFFPLVFSFFLPRALYNICCWWMWRLDASCLISGMDPPAPCLHLQRPVRLWLLGICSFLFCTWHFRNTIYIKYSVVFGPFMTPVATNTHLPPPSPPPSPHHHSLSHPVEPILI